MFTSIINFFRRIFHPNTVSDAPAAAPRVTWKLVVSVLDHPDFESKAAIPLKEAISFIEKFSRFKIQLEVKEFNIDHTYNQSIDGSGNTVYNMLEFEMPRPFLNSLPVADSYLFLFQMFGRLPQLAGSTLGVDRGIMKGGKGRAYATVPVDPWWYNNNPQGGFKTRSASILAHEIINTISSTISVPPYNCTPLVVREHSPDPYVEESTRLKSMQDACYNKLGKDDYWVGH